MNAIHAQRRVRWMAVWSAALASGAAAQCGGEWLPAININGRVTALNAGSTGGLVAAGWFTNVGGIIANGIARWNGVAWTPLGRGFWLDELHDPPWTMAEWSGGLVVGGAVMSSPLAGTFFGVARWDGDSWEEWPREPSNQVHAVLVHEGEVFIGGLFAGGVSRWTGTAWSVLGSGVVGGVFALAIDGNGELVAGGAITAAGNRPVGGIARWNGSTWNPLWSGVDGAVLAIGALPTGDLIVGGAFSSATGVPASNIARWGGGAWTMLGAGVNGAVRAIAVLPDGRVIAGGDFTTAAGEPASRVARWDGTSWSALGAGVNGKVTSAAVMPGGEVVVGGEFTMAGGQAMPYLARWTPSGVPWVALHPRDERAVSGSSVAFSAAPASGYGAVVARWQLESGLGTGEFADLENGAIPGAGGASAAITQPGPGPTVLTITGTSAALHGRRVRAVLNHPCGTVTSAPALLTIRGGGCYANCDGSTTSPVLTASDFVCFLNQFAAGSAYADCDGVGGLTGGDFACFVNATTTGCS